MLPILLGGSLMKLNFDSHGHRVTLASPISYLRYYIVVLSSIHLLYAEIFCREVYRNFCKYTT